MNGEPVVVVLPEERGGLGGHLVYDRRLARALEEAGFALARIEAEGDFPFPTAAARARLAARLAALAPGTTVILDNLVAGAVPELMAEFAPRLRLVVLVHHPLALEHGLLPEESLRLRVAERTALAHAAAVLTPSLAVREVLVRDYRVPPQRITVVPPGIAPGPVARGSGGPRVRLLSVAAVIPRKDHLGLVRALAHIAHLPWELEIVGSTARDLLTTARLREAIAAFGFGERVRLLGERRGEALEEAYARADVFVSASLYEGFGMALLEAVARGLPVVARTGGAVAEVLPPGAVLAVESPSPAALAEALARVIGDVELRTRLRQAALAARSRLPTWEEAAEVIRRRLFTHAPPHPVRAAG